MKHAYLIIAHKESVVLEKLLELLDKKDNDIYIHVDAKTKKFDFKKYERLLAHSKVVFTERTKVYWGDYSQINSELVLLKAATTGKYDYYHLISGQDLPIKSNSWIDDFFEENSGKNFVSVANKPISKSDPGDIFNPYSRLSLFHLWVKWWRKNKILKAMEYVSLQIQRKVGVDRIADLKEQIYYGANWFSITDDCARYVVSQEKHIKELFGKYTRCADELFLQTVLINSHFRNSVTGNNLRYVDFERGKPYVWHKEDKEELLTADGIFARKFDEQIDALIVEEIYSSIKEV